MKFLCSALTFSLLAMGAPACSYALTVPFTEEFSAGAENWKNFASLDVVHIGSGGPDGSAYIEAETAFTNAVMESVILFRGHDLFNSSGDAFVGNWLGSDVRRLSAHVRHEAPEPLQYFARVATPFNFPAVNFLSGTFVQPNTWTLIEFVISPTSPLTTVEGPPANYNTAMTNVGNIQFGAQVPAGQVGNSTLYAFDLDNVSIAVPEPASVMTLISMLAIGCFVRRRVG